jgi:nucleoside-triphosphatase THEP1
MILILTGPTRSHKTTTLVRWANDRNDCGGILTPDHNGLRMLYNVKEKLSIPFEKPQKTIASDIVIGRFVFDVESFNVAAGWLDQHVSDPDLNYVLLDEIGSLELSGQGWDEWLHNSISKIGDKTLILVVRRSLLDEVIGRYHLQEVSVVAKDHFLPEGTEPPLDETDDDDHA